ncbi:MULTISPECIES: oxidoreductase [Deinococcus]|uniref:Oxidoreductase n=1 Tax=Deinococcus rufus TaxID=2136097 RepID=A0ABV7Z9F9_9DEIO|nr:oxidoreductase [Deinococcus sp. AB2017081]WQE96194.1 oxidoreductase [Deinococcus sp. AB2017081]
MTTLQHPIGSDFDAHSTTHDVLRGVDLTGRLALVTGGHSGLGLATTRALAAAGAQVMVLARDHAAAQRVVGDLPGAQVETLDLGDLGSVQAFADRFVASGRDIDMLIGSAGVMACPETRVGPGWETQFAVNHLGHYALVNRLWPALAHGRGARVVAVASGGNPHSRIRWDDPHFTQDYDKWQAYAQSKRANALFAVELDRRGQHAGVRAFSVHPGYILTPLQRHLTRAEMIDAGWIDPDGQPVAGLFKTPEQGAATQVWAATSPDLAGRGGVHCEDADIARTGQDGREQGDSAADAARLWTLSAALTGVDAFGETERGKVSEQPLP